MKNYISIILIATLLSFPVKSISQDCDLPISVVLYPQTEELPQAVESILENQLTRIATTNGLDTGLSNGQFILTARIDILDKSINPGPPIQVVNNLGITFYIADTYTETKFATEYIEVNGVGNNETKSLVNAIRRINANNSKIVALLNNGKKKIITYFDNNYTKILQEAERKVSMQLYEEALMLAISVPVCSKGGEAATKVALDIYAKHIDQYNQILLNKASIIWAAGQNESKAEEAGRILALIDPQATCYGDAQKLAAEIKTQIRKDIDFETREKYHDSVELEKQRIQAIKEVGVAYGKGQKEQTTNLTWLK